MGLGLKDQHGDMKPMIKRIMEKNPAHSSQTSLTSLSLPGSSQPLKTLPLALMLENKLNFGKC